MENHMISTHVTEDSSGDAELSPFPHATVSSIMSALIFFE